MRSRCWRALQRFAFLLVAIASAVRVDAQTITAAGEPAQLDVRAAGPHSLRVTLKPVSFAPDFPATPAVVDRRWPAPVISVRSLTGLPLTISIR